MNKCHYYLSNGLWSVIKCFFEDETKLPDLYFWGLAVAPHQASFSSQIITTPWQQSWASLNLLEEYHGKSKEWASDVFKSSDVAAIRKEVDLQFTLRDFVTDSLVPALFSVLGKHNRGNHVTAEIESEVPADELRSLLTRILSCSPSTAHCLARQLASLLQPLLNDETTDAEFLSLLITTLPEPPPLPRLVFLGDGPCRPQLTLLLLASGHYSSLRRLEAEEKRQVTDSTTTRLYDLVHNGVNPAASFHAMLLTERHFILSLLDLLKQSPPLSQGENIPKFLWPLLLLQLWEKSDTPEHLVQPLIDLCKESTKDKAMLQVCFILEWYGSFSRWSESQGAEQKLSLEAARDHSVLRLIHKSTDLALSDWTQVRALLREPWDLFLMDGYCAMVLLLRAMLSAAAMRRERVRFCDSAAADARHAAQYREEVTEQLEKVKELVKCLQPLRYRLEVLENLFAVLFVTWEDVQGVRRHSQSGQPRSPTNTTRSNAKSFVCGPHFLRDAVFLIKECIGVLEREPKAESELEVPCSIRPSQVENRLDRLTESVSEACWRLQLVTDPEFAGDLTSVTFSHDRYHFEPEWLVETWHEVGKGKRRSCQEKREESGSQSPASGGETERGVERPPGPAFMHQMLSSDSSLVVRCLAQGDLLNADHIITLMSTEERQALEGELNFTQAINDVRKKLQNMSEMPARRPSESTTKSPNRKPTGLQAVQQVAAQGVTATALTNLIERFLSSSILPVIQGSSKLSLGSMLQCMENGAAIVTIDLALTAATSFQDFRDLISLAGKHCPELNTRLQSSCSKPQGYIAFAQTIFSLLQEVHKESEISPPQFLRTRHASFSLKVLKDQEVLWKQLRSLGHELTRSRRDSEAIGKDLVKAQKNIKGVQKILENVSKIAESSVEVLDYARGESGGAELSKNVNSAELLNRYLSDLATLSLDFIPQKSEIEEAVTFHSLLEMSAVEVVDRLVFQHNVDPALLEKKAQQLGFNLCASLVWGCCPPCPQGPALPPIDPPLPDLVVLNDYTEDVEASCTDPVLLTSEILGNLLAALKGLSLENEGCETYISNCYIKLAKGDGKVKTILLQTKAFALARQIDLLEEEKFSFYVNLCNLMTIHCLLHCQTGEAFSSQEPLIREAAFWFLGYDMGSLGFVTLADLQLALCGEHFPRSFRPPSKRLTSISDPRSIFLLPIAQTLGPGPKLLLTNGNPPEEQLTNAITDYSRHYVSLHENLVRVPPLLGWYLEEVLMQGDALSVSEGGNLHPKSRSKVLLEFLLANSKSTEWEATLRKWSNFDLAVEIDSEESTWSVTLSYCSHNHEAPRKTPRPKSSAQQWETRSLTEPILKQIAQSSRVLADIVARIHENDALEGRGVEIGRDVLLDERLRYLEALFSSTWVQTMAPVFRNNGILPGLNKTPDSVALWSYFGGCVSKKDWQSCWRILQALPDFFLNSVADLRRLRDLVLFEIAKSASQPDCNEEGWAYTQMICDVRLRLESVKANQIYWPGEVAIAQFSSILQDEPFLTAENVKEIEDCLNKIKTFVEITEKCEEFRGQHWSSIMSLSRNAPDTVLSSLLQECQLSVCLEWIGLPGILPSVINHINVEFVTRLATLLPLHLPKLLFLLPKERVLPLCANVILDLTSLSGLRSIAELCLKLAPSPSEAILYEKTLLGVQLLSALEDEDRSQLMHLATEPLLMIEQLVLNVRLDSVAIILKRLQQLPNHEKFMAEKDVNDLLTRYASRAVELDLISVINPPAKESFFVPFPSPPEFQVPSEVPDKSQWIPDNQVALCMCCEMVSFSMFNRRHHCRRCGRVICATCSAHRLKVAGYNDVSVRVCQTCYTSHNKRAEIAADNVTETTMSDDIHLWRLSTDHSRNATIREEFAFDHSPNASLCLAIFNLLPDSPVYTSVLLDESEKLLELLQRGQTAKTSEVDYTLLIQIIRALVVGAKVRYGQSGHATGVVSCDRLLSHVDLLSLLVRNHCTHLIPQEPLTSKSMKALRDRLVEEELWDLAIEVSTKVGLPSSGVWATWGKVLLSAGCWAEARQKFSQCLQPTSQSGRCLPWLDEICEILENTTFATPSPNSSAQEVLELLSTLKVLSAGKVPTRNSGGPTSPQYIEQEWYLSRYSNASGLLRFYLRHEQWNIVLTYLHTRQLDPELFVDNILLPAYRLDAHERLKTEMLAMDPTLELFKKYLAAACNQLQKNKLHDTLHDIQVFIQDFVRAAMTCIHLYQSAGTKFSSLLENSDRLQSALKHLEEELASYSNKKVRVPDYVMRLDVKDLNRHINTIWRQLEVAKFLAACETAGQDISALLAHYSWQLNVVPTLFDGTHSRTVLAAICVLAGKNVEEGFGIAYRVIQDCHLSFDEVLKKIAVVLGKQGRGMDVEKLTNCVKTSGAEDVAAACDNVLSASITAMAEADAFSNIEALIPLIANIDLRISALIDAKQLKAAYLLAVKRNRLGLVQRIMQVADNSGQTVIRDICRKKLGQISESASVCSSAPSGESI